MHASEIVVAGCLTVLAVAHSALGESDILRPLFASAWSTSTPRWAVERILRFAWHLTSLSWIALAAAVLGVSLLPAVGVMSLASAAMIFVMLRGHLAWPLFLLAGLAAFHAEGGFDRWVLILGSILAISVMIAAAALHVYWAMGGPWMREVAVPDLPQSSFDPGPILTLAVAVALLVFAGLVGIEASGAGSAATRWLVLAGVAVLAVRAFGDTRVAGFTKTVRDTAFAQADDRYFTPLIVFLALGASASVLA